MHGLTDALWIESLKTRRSKMPLVTLLALGLVPLTSGLFMMIIKDPEWARSAGVISTKAQITTGTADWPGYFDMLSQAVAIGGIILFGLIVIWLFGREITDGTLTDLLAVPVARESTVAAKLLVAACWVALLTTLVFTAGLAIGWMVDLPGWSTSFAIEAGWRLALIALMTFLLVCPFMLAASMARGYLPAVGCVVFAVVLSQIVAALGWGGYFPWSVPAVYSGAAGENARQVHVIGYTLVALTGLTGIAATLAWWRFADHQ
jgi:ABC-2 type transport system permease protein